MRVDHVQLGITGARQFTGLAQNAVVEAFVLVIGMKRVDGGDDLARQDVVQMADKMQRHRAFAQQMDIQWRKHQA
ncbi:hypothetical protein D3C81_2236600 [compost metagenome]